MASSIRQEINLLNATITTSQSGPRAQLDTTRYSGTVSYYFEIVGKVTSGTSTVTLRRSGTSTDDATISLSATSNSRQRSASFTPPAGQTEYFVNISGGTGPSIIAARIVIVQSHTSNGPTATQTQVEIGNQESQSSASNLANVATKYWKYDSTKWDTNTTFYVEAVYSRDSTMSSTTWKLQEDGGSDNFTFSDKTTIVSASTATAITRTRVSFTPTDGRNYRIVAIDSDTMNPNHNLFTAKIVADTAGAGTSLLTMDQLLSPDTGTIYGIYPASNPRGGQSFLGTGGTLETASFSLVTFGSALSGNMNAVLYSHTGTFGSTGTPNALLATSDNVDAATVPGTASMITFTFSGSNRVWLEGGTPYYILFQPAVGNGGNNISMNPSSSSHAGTGWTSLSGLIGGDFTFVVQTSTFTKVEPQMLLANTGSFGGSTGLKDYDTLYDPAEWNAGGGTITHVHEVDGVSAGTGDVKIQSDPNGTPADVTNSTVTDAIQRETSESIDQQQTSVASGAINLLYGGSGTNESMGQSFTVGSSNIIVGRIDVNMDKVQLPTDTIQMTISATLGGTAVATSNTVSSSSLGTSGSPTYISFFFAPSAALTASTKYWFQVTRSGARDTVNYIEMQGSNSDPYAGGGKTVKSSGSWTETSGGDVAFKVYATGMTMPVASQTLDVNVTGTGTLNASRILSQYAYADPSTIFTDTVTVTESVTMLIPTLKPSISDTVTITENFAPNILSRLSVFDTATITENFAGSVNNNISVFDAVTITESISKSNIPLPPSVFDTVTITENTALVIPLLFISVFDTATITENVAIIPTIPIFASVFDTVTITENISLRVNISPSVFDAVTVAESVSVAVAMSVSVFDTVSITENTSIKVLVSVSTFDAVSLTESVSLAIPTVFFSVFDTVTLTEAITAYPTILLLFIFDTVTPSENLEILAFPGYSMPGSAPRSGNSRSQFQMTTAGSSSGALTMTTAGGL